VQRRFAGQSEAFADTSVGKWQRFNNTLDNIKEAIGAGLLPVMTGATDLLVRFADAALPKVEIVVEKINEKVSALAATIIPPLKEQINNLADTVIPLLEGALAAFVGTLETIAQSQEFQAFLDGVEEGLDDLMLVATTAKQIVTDAFDTIGDQFKVAGDKAATAGGKVKITDAQYKELGTTLVQAAAGTATMGAALSLLPQLTIAQGLAIAALFSALVILETRTKVFSRVVGPAFRNAFSWLTAHKDETISALAGIAAMITAVMIPAVVAWTVAEYAKATALLVAGAAFLVANAPLVAIVAGIGLLVAALVYLELKTGFASKSFLFLKDVISAIPGTVTELVNTFTTQFPAIVQIVETVFAVIQNYFMFYIDLYTNLFKIGMALIHGDFGAAWDAIKALFSDSLGHILTHLELVLDLILTVAKEVMPLVKDAIVSALQAGLDFAKSLPGSFAAAGRDIVRGLWEGIQSLAGWLLDKAFAFGKKIYEAVKDGLGKLWPFSPSEAGVDIGKGLGLGILEGTRRILPALQRGMGALTTDLIAPMAPTPSRLSPVTQTASAASTTVAGGGMSIDYDRLASALVRALTGVRVDMDGRAVGEVVTPFVSAIQGRQADLYGRAG
jgi:phage-related protein